MNWVETVLNAFISGFMSLMMAFFMRQLIERRLVQAQTHADEERKRRIRYTALRSEWMWAAGRVLYNLVRIAQGVKQANGDLESAYLEFNEVDCKIKGLDRERSAEIQEE